VNACALALIAIASVAPALAQGTERFTASRVVKYAPGTDKARAQLSAVAAARAVVAGDFAIGAEDLDDDGRKEIILRPLASQCKQVPCTLLVLKQTPNGTVTLFDRPVPPSGLAVTNEKVGGFRALAAVDSTGRILSSGRSSAGGQLVYAMQDAKPQLPPVAPHAAAPKTGAAPLRGGLVGRSITDQAGIDEAFLRAVDCNSSTTTGARHEGNIRGRRFMLVSASCPFEGGNANWGAFLVAFHDGQLITQAIAFSGTLDVNAFIGSRNDRIVYEAIVTRPEDSRCCPSGKAIVEIDVDRQLATATAVGFAARYAPVRGKTLK
jgi:hypothetical protein